MLKRKPTLNRVVHHVPCTIALILMCGFLSILLRAETDWGTGCRPAFNLDEGAQQCEKASQGTDRAGSLWGANAAQNVWSDLDAFERGKAGKTPPLPARFTLPSDPKLDQLFSVIAFAEAPRRSYDVIHGSATCLTASVDLSTKADIAPLG